MDNIIIQDNMKERKSALVICIFCYILSIVFPLSAYFFGNGKFSNIDIIKAFVVLFMLGSLALYLHLYTSKYTLTVSKNELLLKTLFKTYHINLNDIKSVDYNKVRGTVFYAFKLHLNSNVKKIKTIVVWTRYFEKMSETVINTKYNH